MIHSQYAKKIMTWLCTAAMLIPSGLASDSLPVKASVTPVPEDTVVLETDVSTPHDGCTIAGVYGSYYSQAQTALDYINQIRKMPVMPEMFRTPEILPRCSSRMTIDH